MQYALAVDIGGTKATVATVDTAFNIIARREISTGSALDLESALEAATNEVIDATAGELIGVGIGSAGPLDVTAGTISPVNIPSWRPFTTVDFFRTLTKSENVVLHGDGMAVADAEHQLGAGRGSKNMLGMVVSTGVGGGLVLNGKLISGESGNVSFFGHHSINHTGITCVCGRVGCVEAYASGPSMVRRAQELGWSSEKADFITLAESARKEDSHARKAIDEGAHALAVGIINVAAIADLELVVIGGGVSHAGEVYWEPLLKYIASESTHISFLKELKIKKAELLRDAGLLGAALGVLRP
ncbi:NagC Transcriptional regulator/sugar kinase [Candidatus Nanopelagicaceae bacterium]